MRNSFRKADFRLRAALLYAGFLFSARVLGAAPDDYSQWTYSSAIVLNTTAAGITAPVTNFPIVLKLTSSNFNGFSQAKADGSDIRFSTSTGTHLPCQIERWDQTNQLAEVWVRVDNIVNNNGTQYIKMYWGNATALDSAHNTAVFDTANGFQAVWHLGEAGTGNTNDATINGFTGTAVNTPVDDMGIIGRSKKFDGTASSFVVPNSASGKLNFPEGGPYTISAWVKTNFINNLYHDILTKGDHQYGLAQSQDSSWQTTVFKNNVGWLNAHSITRATTTDWKYLTGIRNGTTISLYVDGAKVSDSNGYYNTAIPRVTTWNVVIGGNLDTATYGTGGNGNHLFNGNIDEMSLANTLRSPDWIKLSYENQRPSGIFYGIPTYRPRNLTYSTNPANYVAGTAIATNTPASSGGAPTSYSVAPGLPGGLTLNTGNGQITGTPAAGVGVATANYVVTASNIGGSATVSLSITVLGPPTNLTYSTNPASYLTGTAIAANSPSSGGGAVASYAVAPALPAGLALSPTTGVVTGTPGTATPQANYTVTAANAAGSATVALSITVNAALLPPTNLAYSTNPATYVAGTAIAANSPSSGGGAVASYAVAPALPAGLALSPTTGVVTGTPGTATPQANYTVTAANAAGSATVALSITVNAALLPPTNLAYSTNPATYVAGTAIAANSPSSGGGAVASYAVAPALPAGLALSPTTGVVTGTPGTATPQANYTVTAANAAGSATVALSITVNAALLPPTNLAYSTNPATYVAGTAIAANSPSSGGGAVASYAVAPALPAGLALSPTTGVVTGTPGTATPQANYTVTAANAAGSATVALSITVNAALLPPTNLAYSTNPATYVAGTAIAANSPSSGGGAVASYAVAPALPAGLALNPATGVISGTPTTATAQANYTVTATNAAGSTPATLAITVTAALLPPANLTYSTNPASYVAGTAIAANSPASTGGAVASYSVAPALPAGLALNPATGVISGTPTTATAQANYTVTATNAAGSTPATLAITVTAALLPPANLTYSKNPASYVAGTAIAANSPASTGGAVASYSVSHALPAGLTLNTSTGVITGTPATPTATTFDTVTATNAAGSTTASLSITVYASVKAAIWSHDSSGPAPLTTQFNDTSSGSYSSRRWDFGDGTIDTVSKSPSHTFSTAGTFVVKLAVWGNGGSDTARKTILTWSPLTNPLQMDGKYLMTKPAGDSQKVALLIRNVNAINPPVLVTVDSIGLWFAAGKIPTSPDSSTFRKKYLLSTLQSQVGGQYADTVMVQAVPAVLGYGGFMTVIYWSDGTKTAFSSGNGVLIPMKDTVAPVNDLTLSGAFVPNDTARLSIGNITSIDSNKVDSMFIWYSLTSDSANFGDKTFTKGLSIAEVTKALVNNQYQFSIVDKSFSSAKKTIYCAVMLLGKNDVPSQAKKYQFQVGFDRPANPITLHAKALSATRIQVNWNNVSAGGIDRIVIWYQKSKPVDTVYDVSGRNLDSLTPSVTDTMIIGSNFNEMTHYYFGAQVLKGGLWSQITRNASADDSTPAALGPLDSNTLKALNLTASCPVFDTSTNTIRIGWKVNRSALDSFDIGISYSTVSAAADTIVGQTIVQPARDSDAVAVKLHEDLAFNTSYYVKLWLRKPSGKWTDPGAGTACAVTVPSFTWQSIVYFARDPDSVYAFNREIRLMNQPLDVSTTPNIVRYVVPPAAATGNFTLVSVGFEFSVKDRGTPIYVGLKVDSVPTGFSLTDVRIYRDSAGRMLLSREATVYDPVNRYVSVLTNNYDYPFVAMVDRQVPTCQPLSNLSAYVTASKPVFDTVIVRDNIANCSWRYLTARGGDPYDTSKGKVGGFLNDTIETLAVMIDSNFVTQDNGVRALLIVDDGVHYDTMNLSRSVLKDGSDIAFTEAEKWVPLSVNAEIDTPDAKYVLRELSTGGGASAWKYDDTKFRIFRSYPEPGQTYPWKWVEYADTIAGDFGFVRGNIVWVKSLKQSTVRYGPSHTASLTKSFPITMAPMAWTDFSVPFKFSINVGDILNATTGGDLMEFYEWKRDIITHKYKSELVFLKPMNDAHFNNPATPLSSDAEGYTVFNPGQDTVVLNVPPLPVALSQQGLQKKQGKSSAAGWMVRVVSSEADGSSLSPVYCAFTAVQSGRGVTYYPLAPSFGTVHVGVSDPSGKKVYGLAIAHAMSDGGYAFLLTFVNEGATRARILYHLDNVPSVPHGLNAAVWNGTEGKFDAPSAKGDAAVTVEPGSKEYRTLLVGDAGYLAKARLIGRISLLALVGTYPNPFKSTVRIRYSLPYDGVKNVKFAIYNLSGKVVWRHEVKDVNVSGARDLVWNARATNNRPLAAGIYVLRMTAQNSGLKQVGVFERKMTLLP